MSGQTRDIKDFEFQQLCKIRLFKPPDTVSKQRAELLASASKYGLCFAGFEKNLLVFKTLEVFRIDEEKRMERKSQTIAENFPVLKNLTFSSKIVHIAVSCNELTLLLVLDSSKLLFFDTRAFCLPGGCGPYLVHQIEAGSSVTDLAWNPGTPELLAVCLSTGVVKMFHVSSEVKLVQSIQIEATCLCWSPKGKQVVIGNQQGELKQYAQNLEVKKNWPCPNNLETRVKVLDVIWVSTFMFIAAYETPNDKRIIQIVNVPKDAQPSFVNFRDPCYSFGEERHAKYFFHLLLKWEMVVMASSNSLEAAIVAKNLDTVNSWEHWMLEDSARAEVPITEDKSDSFPLGVAIDYSSPQQIIVNENESIGPFPLLLILSTDGVLVSFHMVYKHKAAVALTNNAENLPTTDIRKSLPDFVVSSGPLVVPSGPSSSPAVAPPGQGQAHFPALQFDAKVVTPTVTPAATFPASGLAPGSSAPFTFGSSTPSAISGGQVPAAPTPQSLGQQFSPFTFTGPPLMAKTADASGAPIILATPKTGFSFSPLPTTTITTGVATAESKNIFGTTSQSQVKFNFAGSSGQSLPASLPTSQVTSTSQAFNFDLANKPFASLSSGPASVTTSITAPAPVVPAISTTAPTKPAAFAAASLSANNFQTNKPFVSLSSGPAAVTTSITAPAPVAPAISTTAPTKPAAFAAASLSANNFQMNQKTTKRNESGGHVISSETPSQLVDPKQQTAINETVDSTFGKNIIDEINDFTQELGKLKGRFKYCREIVGTEAEKKDLKLKTEKMTAFSADVQQTTTVQQKEIAEQKCLLFNLFRIIEECRVKNERNHDVHYHKLLRAQSLDPASAETMNKLNQMQQMVSNGLYDANVVLDQQWEDFQNQSNKKGRKLQPSGVDTVYKVVKQNQSIIQGQKMIVKSIATQLKDLHLYKKNSWSYENIPTIKPGESELSSLANTLIAEERKQSSEVISPKVVTISPLKQSMLREHLTKRSVKIVKAESPGREVSRLSLKDFPKLNLDKEGPIVKQVPEVTIPENQQWQSRGGPELMPDVKRGLSFNSVLSTPDIGTGFFSSGHQTSLEASTPLQSVEKPAPKEGFFSLSTTSITTTNYASGLNLDDVTPANSEIGEEDVGANTGEEWYQEGCEDYEEEEEEEDDEGGEEEEEEEEEEEYAHPVDEEGTEESAREIPDSPDAASSAPLFGFSNTKPDSFPFGVSTNTGFPMPTSTASLFSSNVPSSSSHVATAPLSKTNLFGTAAASSFSSPNVLAPAAADSSTNQFDVPAASTRLRLLATPTPVASSGVSKNLFAGTSASTPSFNFSEASSKPVEPFAQGPSSSNETPNPAVSSTTNDKPASIIKSPSSETTTGSLVSIPVSSLSQTAITPTTAIAITTTTSPAAVVSPASTTSTTEASKPNVTFSFTSPANPDQTSQPTTSLFGSQLMFKTPTSNLTPSFGSNAMPSSGLFQSSSSSPAASSPAAGLFTLPSSSSTASEMLFKATAAPVATTAAATTVVTTTSTSSTSSFAFSLNTKPSIATGTVASSSAPIPAPDLGPAVTTTSTSTLGSLLSSPVPVKSDGLLHSLTGASSTTGAAEAAAAAAVAAAAATAAVSTTPATTGLFSPSSTAASTVFGQPSSPSSTSPVLVTELFKQSPATTFAGLFGKPASSSSSDLFGKTSPAPGLFSQPSAGTTSLFGQATASSGNSITSGTTAGAVFGSAKSVFGNAPAGALFGATPSSTVTQPAATSSSPFGQSSISGFGQGTSTTAFGKAAFGQSAFGQSSDSFKTGGSPFGQSGASSSVFGQASSTTVFGQSPSSAGGGAGSVFGNASSTSSSTPAAAAGAASSTGAGGPFGSSSPFFSGLGGKPSQENVDKNVFGSTNQVFGQSSPQTAATLFGNQSPNSGFKSVPLSSPKLGTSFGFGSTAGSGTAGTSSTTSAGSSVAATGFGVGQQQSQQQQSQSPGVFGGSASFGSSASFGGAPAFGNKSAFGFGSSTFGSNVPAFSNPFGGAQAGSVFGQAATSSQATNSSGFANFAQSSSPTFGSLAQTSPSFGQQQQQQQQQQTTNTAFGGSGFGSPVPSFGSNSGSGSFGSGSAFGQSASFTGYRS